MNKKAFSLIELLIVVAVIAILVGVAMPYYQDYVKQSRITKAKHELDILKEALIKHDTFEEKPFHSDDLRLLIGHYLQDLPRDPWGRDYEIDYLKGCVRSLGPDHGVDFDDIIVDYKPPLTLIKASWVDSDNNKTISSSDFLRLEFSRFLATGTATDTTGVSDFRLTVDGTFTFGDEAASSTSTLWFSDDVDFNNLCKTASWTNQPDASTTEILFKFVDNASPTALFPGSSTVCVGGGNKFLIDYQGRYAAGTKNEPPAVPVVIQGK